MPSPSLVVVLVEDAHHRTLIYRYLRRCGLSQHQITIKLSPSGRGSAEQWVRKVFATEVKAYRIRQARAASALVVMIDADSHSVEERLVRLREALQQSGAAQIRAEEHIAQLIPKRNVETWILCLTRQAVDEETDYKRAHHDWQGLIPEAAITLFQWGGTNAAFPDNVVDSLMHGLRQLGRLAF